MVLYTEIFFFIGLVAIFEGYDQVQFKKHLNIRTFEYLFVESRIFLFSGFPARAFFRYLSKVYFSTHFNQLNAQLDDFASENDKTNTARFASEHWSQKQEACSFVLTFLNTVK